MSTSWESTIFFGPMANGAIPTGTTLQVTKKNGAACSGAAPEKNIYVQGKMKISR